MLYTDGGRKQGIVGWSFAILNMGKVLAFVSGSDKGTIPVAGEFKALYKSLHYLLEKGMVTKVCHYTDNQQLSLVVNGLKLPKKKYEVKVCRAVKHYTKIGGSIITRHISRRHPCIRFCDKGVRKEYIKNETVIH